MNKLANVVYAYSPKNDDELELSVGDKIEVIGIEEEGWWMGKLKGRIGVFPSNFVEVIETSSPTTSQTQNPTIANNISAQVNKLNLFGKTSKTSLSTNSLNSNNSNSNSINNNHLMMNNTQHQDNNIGLACGEDANSSERRPKPIRGVGYGDIFATAGRTRPLPADPTGNFVSERLTTNIANTLQKQIPKKPPPPTPIDNGNSGHQAAPALPPKPTNQFSPHSRPLPPTQQPFVQSLPQLQHQAIQKKREQAKVIYAYEPANGDELAMKVGDIIDIIDKDIEDVGWWRGELRGKVGVFPDNFVQLIEVPDAPTNLNHEWSSVKPSSTSQPTTPVANPNIEGRIKSVFAGTPKGFSKELENNLEKHNGPASFLSLKRNKLHHQTNSSLASESSFDENGKNDVEDAANSLDTSPTMKLNHITANRAKGPSRRPPSNYTIKRNQTDLPSKRETNGRDDTNIGNSQASMPVTQTINYDSLSSLPASQHANSNVNSYMKQTDGLQTRPIKPSLSLDNVVEDNQQATNNHTPKTSQRASQISGAQDKSKTNTTPPWMVELKKAHAEKKRDTPTITGNSVISHQEDTKSLNQLSSTKSTEPSTNISSIIPNAAAAITATATNNINNATITNNTNNVTVDASAIQQISKDVTNEINELREDIKRLQLDFKCINELKSAVETMKVDLKACQIATENQKRYIKELVGNLSDERKKIAAMQVEIDKNLKFNSSNKLC